jgi:prevent-host-death family protein
MRTEPLASVKAHLSAMVDEIARTHEQYVVTRNGTPVVVMMAADDFEALMETLALLRDQEGIQRLAEAELAVAAGDVTTRDEMAAIMAERERREAE